VDLLLWENKQNLLETRLNLTSAKFLLVHSKMDAAVVAIFTLASAPVESNISGLYLALVE